MKIAIGADMDLKRKKSMIWIQQSSHFLFLKKELQRFHQRYSGVGHELVTNNTLVNGMKIKNFDPQERKCSGDLTHLFLFTVQGNVIVDCLLSI